MAAIGEGTRVAHLARGQARCEMGRVSGRCRDACASAWGRRRAAGSAAGGGHAYGGQRLTQSCRANGGATGRPDQRVPGIRRSADMKRSGISLALSMFALLALVGSAAAASPQFKHGGEPTFRDNGKTLSVRASLTGLGNGDLN